MKRNDALVTAQFLLTLLGIGIVLIAIFIEEKFSFIPVLNGVSLFIISWTLSFLKRKQR